MKSLLTRIIVSGAFVLLVTFTLTPRSHAKPAGYTSDGQPYYYAYPNEGYAPEPSQPYAIPPYGLPYESTSPDQSTYGEPGVDYTNWGWGWGWPFGFNGFNFDMNRHHFRNFNHVNHNFFARHDAFNRSFTSHTGVKVHQNIAGRRTAGAHVGFRGGGRGGGHR